MRIQSLSMIVGDTRCNAKCPFCVSKMTPKQGVDSSNFNWRNLHKALRMAQINGVTNIMLTGKGEPLLHPELITNILKVIKPFDFPIIELQTNGICLKKIKKSGLLEKWYDLGLTIVALSTVHYKMEKNREIYSPSYKDLEENFDILRDLFSIRVNCIMLDNYMGSQSAIENMIRYARENEVDQLNIRKLGRPVKSTNREVWRWINDNQVRNVTAIYEYVERYGSKLMTLPHGGVIFDVDGQNVCLSDCLTIKPESDDVRQLIYFPDGHLRYDWQYEGAVLI
jgi:molybdenum cofactor biosynthesis enzyme MoaA